jgi:DNA-binding Lrp family transcriptional regulator
LTKVNKWVIPVIFSEEQYNISELANLWENICHTLEDYYGFENLYTEVEQHISKTNFEELAYDVLEKHLNKHKKKLVLLIDNIGDLLHKLEDKEIRRLRELLQTKSQIRVIAASLFYLDNVLDYKQPFFEFFKVHRLDGLGKEETDQLLLKLGEVYNEKAKIERILKETPERVETLRVLTGGVPRTIALMFRIFVDHEHESSVKDMERILDAVTPLYKHRMDDLPKQQQKIIDAVARNWDAISVKELKEKIRLDSKTISAQLNQLEKNQIIEKRTSKTKNHLYLIKERFWNIWYLMRYGRKFDKERVVWLVRFMECWFSRQELEQRVQDFIRKIKNNELPESAIQLFGVVYASLESITLELRMNLKDNLPADVANAILIDNKEILKAALDKAINKNYEEALNFVRKINNLDENAKLGLLLLLKTIPLKFLIKYFNGIATFTPVKEANETDISLIFLFIILFTNAFIFDERINWESIDTQNSLNQGLESIKNGLKDRPHTDTDTVEIMMVNYLFKNFIIANKVNIAYNFFTGDDADYFKSKLEMSYILVEYYRQNQDEGVLLRLPDEKKQIILEEIEQINKERNTFKPLKN